MLSQQSKEALRVLGVDEKAAEIYLPPDVDTFMNYLDRQAATKSASGNRQWPAMQSVAHCFGLPVNVVTKIIVRCFGNG